MSDVVAELDRAIENADLDDHFDGHAADAVMRAAKNVESMRYFVSVGRVADAALKEPTEAKRAAYVVAQAEQAPDHLGAGAILRYSEAFAAWSEGKWSPPESCFHPNAAVEARRIVVLAFLADVRLDVEARAKGKSKPRRR